MIIYKLFKEEEDTEMAIYRNGFISNSSSSSFLIVGVEINKPNKEKMKEIMTKAEFDWESDEYSELDVDDIFYGEFICGNEQNLTIKDSESAGCSSKKIVIGYDLGGGEEYGCDKITMKEIKEAEKKLQDFLDTQEEANIYAGTEYNG